MWILVLVLCALSFISVSAAAEAEESELSRGTKHLSLRKVNNSSPIPTSMNSGNLATVTTTNGIAQQGNTPVNSPPIPPSHTSRSFASPPPSNAPK